jgi:hypothetical protein
MTLAQEKALLGRFAKAAGGRGYAEHSRSQGARRTRSINTGCLSRKSQIACSSGSSRT